MRYFLMTNLGLNFRPSTTLKEKIENVTPELNGVYKYLDLVPKTRCTKKLSNPSLSLRTITEIKVATKVVATTTLWNRECRKKSRMAKVEKAFVI